MGIKLANASMPDSGRSRRGELVRILLLVLLTAGIHAWLIVHTEVLARDGVGFIRYAWRLQHEPWGQVLASSHQHPGYPLAIVAVSRPVAWFMNGPVLNQMLLSAQLVNLLAGCLLAIVMYLVGKELFNAQVGFWTAALFQCLPVAARVTSDTLSEATFLLTACITLLLAVRSLRDHAVWRWALCGAYGGCCYLIRPEGALTVVAITLVLAALQVTARGRRPWRQMLPATAGFLGAAALVAGPYIAVIGHFTNKPTGQAVMELACSQEPRTKNQPPGGPSAFRTPHSAFGACLWAVWWHGDRPGSGERRLAWGGWAVTTELLRGFGYIAWLPALCGLYWFRQRWRNDPALWILLLLGLMQAVILCRVGLVVGYVSERHVLIIVLCALYWAVAAIFELENSKSQIQNPKSKIQNDLLSGIWHLAFGIWHLVLRIWNLVLGIYVRVGARGILAIVMLGCLPICLQPLHANQVGHREAGLWLAEHIHPGDVVIDPFDWSYFYAGRVFEEQKQFSEHATQEPIGYVVLELTRRQHEELPMLPLAQRLAEGAQLVYDWQPNRHQHKAQEVQIFAVSRKSQ